MPRSSEEAVGKVLAYLRERGERGATSNEVARSLGVPDRTARRYLAKLFERRSVTRFAEYAGDPTITFHYRYVAAKPRAAPVLKR